MVVLDVLSAATKHSGDFVLHEDILTIRAGLILLLALPYFIISVKRCHDLDKSGFWTLINVIPVVGHIWFLIQFGFFNGTKGQNRFGPDPKDHSALKGE
jgi:uncharacterized membrane protein YhaH (DUF805 family)